MIREENGTGNEKRISDEYRALIYLIGCALNDLTPDEDEYLKADAETLYQIAKRHSVTSLTAHALSKNGYKGMDTYPMIRRINTARQEILNSPNSGTRKIYRRNRYLTTR